MRGCATFDFRETYIVDYVEFSKQPNQTGVHHAQMLKS